jgi:hypothetical protein
MSIRNPEKVIVDINNLKRPVGKYDHITEFLNSVVIKYAEFNNEFYRTKVLTDLPFSYGELQNKSIFWNSMRNSLKGTLPFSEQRYKKKEVNKNQWLDYWVALLPKKTVLWIEYKHRIGYFNRQNKFDSKTTGINSLTGIAKDFERDFHKLKNMTPTKYKDLCLGSGRELWPVIKITLLILPLCLRIKKKKGEILSKEENLNINQEEFSSLVDGIEKKWTSKIKPNWITAWTLHKDIQKLVDWPDEKDKNVTWWDKNFGVYFLARLD